MTQHVSNVAKDTWKVATTFVGTIVGAGFASGQELLKFFSHFGADGILGLFLSCLLFCVSGTMIMIISSKLRAVSFGEVIRVVCGKHIGPFMDLLLSLFLFGTLSVMLAGSGAVFLQQWGISFWFGTSLTLVITILTVLFGLKGIIKANSIVVPFMIAFCLLATLPALSIESLTAALKDFIPAGRGAASHWLLSSLLYASYNITLSVCVLAPLGSEIKDRRPIILGGIIGGLGLGSLAMFINLAILSHYPTSALFEIPSLYLVRHFSTIIQFVFSLVLWAEIFTTIIGTIFGLSVRVAEFTGYSYLRTTVILMFLALGLSQAGFSGLVGTLYPLIGYISLVFLLMLFIFPIAQKIKLLTRHR